MTTLLTPTDEPGVFSLRIDNSSLESFTTCARNAEHTLVDKKRPAGRRSPLEFGSAIHDALEHRYRLAVNRPLTDEEKHQVIQRAVSYLTTVSPPEADDWRNASQAHDVLVKYFETYATEVFTVLDVENAFSLPLCEIPVDLVDPRTKQHVDLVKVYWTGKMDVIARNLNNQTFLIDHKTSSMLGPSYYRQFENSQQMHGYCWAASEIYNTPVRTVLINVLGSRKPTRTGKSIQLERQFYHYPNYMIDNWRHNVETLVADFLSHYFRDYFPMQTAWCVGKYGDCPFLDVCLLEPAQRRVMLDSANYEDNTWSPLD